MDRDDEFVGKALHELNDLKQQETQLAATEDGIRRKRTQLQTRVVDLERSLKIYRELMGLTQTGPKTASLFGEAPPQGTVAEMATDVMLSAGGQASVSDIAQALTRVGKLSNEGRSAYATVYSILHRDKRFKKLGEGVFALATPDASAQQQPAEQSPGVPLAESASAAE